MPCRSSCPAPCRRGTVTVEVLYEQPGSFQEGTRGARERQVFEEVFSEGQRIAINQTFESGTGIYTVLLHFEDATGLFRVRLPKSSQL